MEKMIKVNYNVVSKTLEITENDFTTFEAFGVLEAAKQMIANGWLNTEVDN